MRVGTRFYLAGAPSPPQVASRRVTWSGCLWCSLLTPLDTASGTLGPLPQTAPTRTRQHQCEQSWILTTAAYLVEHRFSFDVTELCEGQEERTHRNTRPASCMQTQWFSSGGSGSWRPQNLD
ncbi:hypothetical protein RRG08_032314 [Elysia crispata]|uniref:Uncharacterized protein n=1 Tax=Elysia crispata TaxID=231223 RepID=A0AAE1E3I2_9GAST|nr:hypothetical protein RRG08_032314 [Elysia crispata]